MPNSCIFFEYKIYIYFKLLKMKNLENLFNTSFIYLFFVVAIFIQSCGQNCLDSETFREKREMVAIDETYGKSIYRTKIDGEFYTRNKMV